MSATQHFTHLGVPMSGVSQYNENTEGEDPLEVFYPDKVDVTDDSDMTPPTGDYELGWITLSGHSSDAGGIPGEASIAKSRELAYKLHYNLKSVEGTVGDDQDTETSWPLNVWNESMFPDPDEGDNVYELYHSDVDNNTDPLHEPYQRTARQPYHEFTTYYEEPDYQGPYQRHLGFSPKIVRMYLGSTTNEGNFIGFGLSMSGINILDFESLGIGLGYFSYTGSEAWPEPEDEFDPIGLRSSSQFDSFTSDGDTFHFISACYSSGGGTESVCLHTPPKAEQVYDTYSTLITITGFTFYTY